MSNASTPPTTPAAKTTGAAFASLPLDPAQLENLAAHSFTEMTPIQEQALPALLDGKDVMGQANTGSGKTIAFGLGLIDKLDIDERHVQALVICPTRELAQQVTTVLRTLAKHLPNTRVLPLCGGEPKRLQTEALNRGSHIVVGTPGRLLDHIQNDTIDLSKVTALVLDEADRLLDMGFSDDIIAIVAATPVSRQTALFSATYPNSIKQLSRKLQREPVAVKASATGKATIEQQAILCEYDDKPSVLNEVLLEQLTGNQQGHRNGIVFCNTIVSTKALASELRNAGWFVRPLHGDLSQNERYQVLSQFQNDSLTLITATDVAARGLDIQELDLVVNYELPQSPEQYTHRIGRTGRAGLQGKAVTLLAGRDQSQWALIQSDANEQAIEPVRAATPDSSPYGKANKKPAIPDMVTLAIRGGRRDKLRAGDIVGAITSHEQIEAQHLGKIDLYDSVTYVAVSRHHVATILSHLQNGKIKRRRYRVGAL